MAHRGFSEADARARIARQVSRDERLARADFVIRNDGALSELAPQIRRCWDWIAAARRHESPPWPDRLRAGVGPARRAAGTPPAAAAQPRPRRRPRSLRQPALGIDPVADGPPLVEAGVHDAGSSSGRRRLSLAR